jgi:anti-sigma B factor antagonist
MPGARLTMDAVINEARATVTLRGELDIATAPDVEERATVLLRHRSIDHLTFDMAGVSFVDSAGLAALVRISQRAHAVDCTLALINVRPLVQRVLDVTGLADVLNVQDEVPPPQ